MQFGKRINVFFRVLQEIKGRVSSRRPKLLHLVYVSFFLIFLLWNHDQHRYVLGKVNVPEQFDNPLAFVCCRECFHQNLTLRLAISANVYCTHESTQSVGWIAALKYEAASALLSKRALSKSSSRETPVAHSPEVPVKGPSIGSVRKTKPLHRVPVQRTY